MKELTEAEKNTYNKVTDYMKSNNVRQWNALKALKLSSSTFYKAKRKIEGIEKPNGSINKPMTTNRPYKRKPAMMTLTVHEPVKNIVAFYGDPNTVIDAIRKINGGL